ncbi:unnamed protein product [Mytilus coruscus]|uniref:Integrase catalytic domain-containing protein n=1 Tax=Mytilus coruscus TaxID=42192 RepID=A0A6J8A0U9_MYTCO|nr:unnamed protein product [Mytilus coruscus]
MNKELYYKSLTARFKNKAPYRPAVSQGVHHILQIDLVDMQRHKVTHRKKIFKYVLSILDVFSRYVWLRPLQNKNSATVKRELKSLFEEFGEPKVIQHDCGKEFEGEVRIFLKKKKNQADKEPSIPPAESGKSGKNAFNFEKKKIAFDLLKMKQVGVNWVRQLQKYERKINDGPKECLAWKCPFEIYYGRTRQSHLRKSIKSPQVWEDHVKHNRNLAQKATRHCNDRKNKAWMKKSKTPIYEVGQQVLVRYRTRNNNRVPNKAWYCHKS